MPRLPTITSSKLVAVLQAIGFIVDHQSGSHLILWRAEDKRRVVVPVHKGDLGRGLTLKIIKSTGLTRDEFIELLGNL